MALAGPCSEAPESLTAAPESGVPTAVGPAGVTRGRSASATAGPRAAAGRGSAASEDPSAAVVRSQRRLGGIPVDRRAPSSHMARPRMAHPMKSQRAPGHPTAVSTLRRGEGGVGAAAPGAGTARAPAPSVSGRRAAGRASGAGGGSGGAAGGATGGGGLGAAAAAGGPAVCDAAGAGGAGAAGAAGRAGSAGGCVGGPGDVAAAGAARARGRGSWA